MSSRTRRPATGFGLKLAGGLAIAAVLQGVIFLAVLERTVGAKELGQGLLNAIGGSSGPRVAILKSAQSARWGDEPEAYYNLERQWELALSEAGIRYQVIEDNALAPELAQTADVVVLPAAVCLNESQRLAIGSLLNANVGIVTSGALGARDAQCQWRGFSFLAATTGLVEPNAIDVEAESAIFRGGEYFSHEIPAGYRLALPAQEVIVGTSEAPSAFLGDARLRPNTGRLQSATLSMHSTRGAGRLVWFGFRETLPNNRLLEDRETLNDFLRASVMWAGRRPLAALGNWPNRATAAVMMTEEANTPEEALPAASVFEAAKVPATFVIPSEAAAAQAETVQALAKWGTVASSGDSLEPLRGQDQAAQATRLTTIRRSLLSGTFGLVPPQDMWDEKTIAAMRATGFGYLLDRSTITQAVPQVIGAQAAGILDLPQSGVLRLPAVGGDDLETIAAYTGPSPWGDDLAQEFLPALRDSSFVGGLHTLLFRSDLLGAPDNTSILRTLVERVKSEPVWLASAKDVHDWWSARDQVRVEVRRVTPTRVEVALTNRGSTTLRDASAYVYLPSHPKTMNVVPELLGRPTPKAELLPGGDNVLRLDFEELAPQSSYMYLVVFDEN